MAKAYSYDLRIRTVEAIDKGESFKKVSEIYKVSQPTIYRWIQQRALEGDIKPKENWRKGYGHKIRDLEKFRIFVENNAHKTLIELAEEWGGVKKMTIQRALKKIGYTHKKNNLWVCRTERGRAAEL